MHDDMHDPADHRPDSPDLADSPAADSPERPPGRLRRCIDAVNYRSWYLVSSAYVAAGTAIGFDSLAVLIGFSELWPVAMPAVILAIGVSAIVRTAIARRRAARGHSPAALSDSQRGSQDESIAQRRERE